MNPLQQTSAAEAGALPRHDWTAIEARRLYELPFPVLIHQAQTIHRRHFDPGAVEAASLLSIKTGGCPEDCGYCSQSAHHDSGVKATALMPLPDVIAAAKRAKAAGASRFCMAAAWRSPRERDVERVTEMVRSVKALGLQTCATLGMLTAGQARELRDAGLDFYNHNVDTSPAYYPAIIGTRTQQDRLDTLAHVRAAGMKVCCGGIVGLGEHTQDRIDMLVLLANLPEHPHSVPLNLWSEVRGVPVERTHEAPDPIEFVRLVALARLMMPRSVVRLSAARQTLSDEAQALCLLAGANSIFIGERLLTTGNPDVASDQALLGRLGMRTV